MPEPEVDLSFIVCHTCGEQASATNIDGWFGKHDPNDQPEYFVCSTCYVPGTEGGKFSPIMLPSFPIKAAFKPAKTNEEIILARALTFHASYWLDIEQQILDTFTEFGDKVMYFNVGSHYYKGISITPVWQDGNIIALEATGDDSKTKLQLDIYQTHRLATMGYVNNHERPQSWRLDLTTEEQGYSNVARIISHTLEFGYLIKPPRMHSLTPILDIDAREYNKKAKG